MIDKLKRWLAPMVNDEAARLTKANDRLKDLNADLDGQVRDLLKSHPISDSELADIARVRQEHVMAKKEIEDVVIYVRNNFGEEMARGRFAGMNMAQMVLTLLGELVHWRKRAEIMKGKGDVLDTL